MTDLGDTVSQLTAEQRREITAVLTVLATTARNCATLVLAERHTTEGILHDLSAIDALAARIRTTIRKDAE